MVRLCQVCRKLNFNHENLTFHRFPSDPERRKIWFVLLGFDQNKRLPKSSDVCSEHFAKEDFHYKDNGRKYLNKDADPLPCQVHCSSFENVCTNTIIMEKPQIIIKAEPLDKQDVRDQEGHLADKEEDSNKKSNKKNMEGTSVKTVVEEKANNKNMPFTYSKWRLLRAQRNTTLTYFGSRTTFDYEPVEFKICEVKEFSQIPGFDPHDQAVVTMILNDTHEHNLVYYKGRVYVDDRTLSCERGKRTTRRSCNLLYMCVNSMACSAGLITNVPRTTIRQVGLHSCLQTDVVINNSHTVPRELKPVKFCHSEGPKPDMQGIGDSTQVVATYFENGKHAAAYGGCTYLDPAPACSYSVGSSFSMGCKCLFMCKNKHLGCSAGILVHSRWEVLEVGLHSCRTVIAGNGCQTQPVTSDRVASLIPSTSLLNYRGFGSLAMSKGVATKSQSSSQQINRNKKKSSQELPQGNSVKRLKTNGTKRNRKKSSQELLQGNSVKQLLKTNGTKRNRRDDKGSQKVESSKKTKKTFSYKDAIISNQLKRKLQDVLFEEQMSSSTRKAAPTKGRQRFMEMTKKFKWNARIIPVLDSSEDLCVIHKGHIYSYKHCTKRSFLSGSEWTCLQSSCSAVLHLDETKVTFASKHSCRLLSSSACLKSADVSLLFRILRGEERYLVYGRHIYHLSDSQIMSRGLSLNCIYKDLVGCPGALSMENDGPISLLLHSCKQTFDAEEQNCHNPVVVKESCPSSLGAASFILPDVVVQEAETDRDDDDGESCVDLALETGHSNCEDNFTIKEEVVSPVDSTMSSEIIIKEEDVDNNPIFMDHVTVDEEVLEETSEFLATQTDSTTIKNVVEQIHVDNNYSSLDSDEYYADCIDVKEEVLEEIIDDVSSVEDCAYLDQDSTDSTLVFNNVNIKEDTSVTKVVNTCSNIYVNTLNINSNDIVEARKKPKSKSKILEKLLLSSLNSDCNESSPSRGANSNDLDFFEDVEDAIPISVVVANRVGD